MHHLLIVGVPYLFFETGHCPSLSSILLRDLISYIIWFTSDPLSMGATLSPNGALRPVPTDIIDERWGAHGKGGQYILDVKLNVRVYCRGRTCDVEQCVCAGIFIRQNCTQLCSLGCWEKLFRFIRRKNSVFG